MLTLENLKPLLLAELESEDVYREYISLKVDIEELPSLLDWSVHYAQWPGYYFKSRDNDFESAGIGQALVLSGHDLETFCQQIQNLPTDFNWRLFGGLSFNSKGSCAREWQNFGKYHFSAPRFFIERKAEKSYFGLNLRGPFTSMAEIIQQVEEQFQTLTTYKPDQQKGTLHTGHQYLLPDKEDWKTLVEKTLDKIAKKDVYKIVLGRKRILKGKQGWDLPSLLRKIDNLNERSYVFYYRLGAQEAFLSCTPERLFKSYDGKLYSDAIAGTRPRGSNEWEDQQLAGELKNSKKEIEEHRFVSRSIERSMQHLCSEYRQLADTDILKLQNLQHLCSRYVGRLKAGVHVLELIQEFHPTPAVGGVPQDMAKALIESLEPFDRGWYASPVGHFTLDTADFAVGIRSALVSGKELHIYAGAGIVEGSNAASEWQETENKMLNYLQGLGEF